ncbi:coiled-coil domain-containing protein 124-like isoform X2 [Patiria miniata]|nr:coiled-coil domain-containing protein 124-like isoform X2 [Patiria miniata]XP_038073177.1 coiled-coil domain-containing protein 124-like isoform X2 [Patiria miniata]XP_038073178.1 coiled-coil domain-containing protein 124-like isoform X2 [Patiria miniata]XP_038073179.1 coiled-coil domain-containing protein 124-like isoform X2 [Patiria miniata]XP_038073180.1 coiled-coil domain-containing protein 124-like isoform X2 [Patiria miniata]
MPKKFQGENSKAAVAKARKAAVEHEKQAARQKAEEDSYWEDDDKHVKKKQQRKENKEKKHEEQTSRKQEARRLLEEEEEMIKASAKTVKPSKLTRAQIQADREIVAAAEAAERMKQEPTTHLDTPLEENPNLVLAEQAAAGVTVGRNVEEAISALSVNDPALDKHPEKRVKAAYKAFEDLNLPRLKAENPNLRMSQLKQMLKKDWARSPDNPLNQRTAVYNDK